MGNNIQLETVTDASSSGTDQDFRPVSGSDIGTKRCLDVVSAPSAGSTAVLATYIDSATTAGAVYYGWASPGTATSAASWKILKETITASLTTYTWADSNGSFDNVWDNRASLSYG